VSEWNQCWYCGLTLGKRSRTHDHFIARTLGGTSFVTACGDCNSRKGDLDVEDWRIVGFGQHYRFVGEVYGWRPW
jgi:5-methylcytosine-specific restriction endonuclease McrA